MIRSHDWWRTDAVAFEGERCLTDAAEQTDPESSARAIARLFIIDLIGAAVGDGAAPTGLNEAAVYLTAIFTTGDPEGIALGECLAAVSVGDGSSLAGRLHRAARICAGRSAMHAARSLAELSYEASLACGSWRDALAAARVLERLAELDECPRAAERWRRRGDVHARRVRRQR